MNFRTVNVLDAVIEVEQVETGHRMSFSVLPDRSDLLRGSLFANPAAESPNKACWRGGYFHARRVAMNTGILVQSHSPLTEGGETIPLSRSTGFDQLES